MADPEGEGEIAGASNDIDTDSPARLRHIILALILLSIMGLLVELVLLEHYDSAWQWTPLALLGVALVSTSVVLRRPTRAAIRLFQGLMTLFIVAGALGLWLHYRGNVEFEIERDASLNGLALFWEALRGATPALAPAAMAQLGLLGLTFTHRHPALRRSTTVRSLADTDREETR